MKYSKPNIIISKCINFDNCRYNWDIIKDKFLEKLSSFVNFIPVCPEVAIWLWTPRATLRIQKNEKWENKLIQPSTNLDLTEKMIDFSKNFLEKQENIDWFVMKNRSPSCWTWDVKVYEWTFAMRNWVWVFAQNINTYFENIPTEDEWRLKNFRIREDFLTKIFCLSDFRRVKVSKDIKELTNFQTINKYLFMYYSPLKQKELWRIVASYNKNNLEEIINKYYLKLIELIYFNPKVWKRINALTHIFWYFKKKCNKQEKDFFLETLDEYKKWNIPTSSVINILKTWALRDNQKYILDQTILNPYPKELIELTDSGKVLKL